MYESLTLLTAIPLEVVLVPMDVPPITPIEPTGFDKLGSLLNYIAWGVVLCCAAGFLIAAGKLGLALRNGGEVEGFKGLVLAMVGAILVGGTTTLFNLLT